MRNVNPVDSERLPSDGDSGPAGGTPPNGSISCPLPITRRETIQMGHGSGGRMMTDLIRDVLAGQYGNEGLNRFEDFGRISHGDTRVVVSTDSFVVDPIFFPGGDIGELAVYGTVNDVAMSGARPVAISVAMILEEGFPIQDLRRISESIRRAADHAGVTVVTGDTKVVGRGKGDGIYINTTGFGFVERSPSPSVEAIRPGDLLLLNGTIAEHGMAILSKREGLRFDMPIESDCAPLGGLVAEIMDAGRSGIHAMRDATRGGVAAVLNEFAQTANVGVRIREDRIPVQEAVAGACAILGFDPLTVANEGKMIVVVEPSAAERVLEAMRSHPLGKHAVLIGDCVDADAGRVILHTSIGGRRVVGVPVGELLPRIC